MIYIPVSFSYGVLIGFNRQRYMLRCFFSIKCNCSITQIRNFAKRSKNYKGKYNAFDSNNKMIIELTIISTRKLREFFYLTAT